MEHIDQKGMRLAVITSFIYMAMVGVCGFGLWRHGLDKLPPMYVMNVALEMFAMLAGYVLFISCIADVKKSGTDLKWFIYMLNITIYWAFTDAGSWLLEGVAHLRWLNIVDNTILFLCTPISAYCFWKYLTGHLILNKPFERFLDKALKYILFLAIILRVVNLFTGMYFTVDAGGVYQRGPLYAVSMLSSVLTLLAVAAVTVAERKQLQIYQIVAAVLYILAPFVATVLTFLFYGLSISSSVIMLILLLMYCVLNITQGRERAAADRDLAVASNIQKNVLPKIFPYLPERKEFDIYATMTPAKEVGGDFYDFFMIDDDHIAIVIADVSGKGMPAALFMMVARTLIKNQTQSASFDKDPKEILAQVNNQLCEGNDMDLFVTAWIGIITLSTGHLEYASAGHEYPAFSKGGKDFFILKERNSPPLATMEGLKFHGGDMELQKGDVIYVYTDGVTEATSAENELFGLDRMLDALNIDVNADLQQIDTNVRSSIDDFVQDAPQFDDITMLTFRYNGAK